MWRPRSPGSHIRNNGASWPSTVPNPDNPERIRTFSRLAVTGRTKGDEIVHRLASAADGNARNGIL